MVDQDNFEVALGGDEKVGKLCLRGPMVIKAYKGNNLITTGKAIDFNGWLHTGDLTYYDEYGCFFHRLSTYIIKVPNVLHYKKIYQIKGFTI